MAFELLMQIIFLVIGFYAIIKSADIFIDKASAIGNHLKLSKLTIGLTIVAIGTSLPELFTTIGAVLFTQDPSDFIIGTVMGSNIANILLVFGIFLIYTKTFTIKKSEKFNTITLIILTLTFSLFIYFGFSNYLAIFLLIFYGIYLTYMAKYKKEEIIEEEEEEVTKIKKESIKKSTLFLILCIIGLFAGAKIVTSSIEKIGTLLSIPSAYLTLTTVALATSLPEVAVTILTAKKKQFMIGIGNIIGSNIANIALVFGLFGFLGYYAIETSLYLESLKFLLISTLLFSILLFRKKFYRWCGCAFLVLYTIYIIKFFI